ncbi:hypothetical protein [Faecalibacter bovis]|uniref:Peptidase S74 domain-containing protein n=1 Tax=Faecalibacter bovis TaxID=2898187 RepID=A0ABX7XBW6_9FLAO|nr:hypothetical protein [Faecalibacter bovis]QTV05282.1 hypothetical protein J9309_10920 [Faecalibacter bovis]
MKKTLILLSICISNFIFAQVGINTENPKATLDVSKSIDNNLLDGIIAPRLTANELNLKTYTTNQIGAIVYVTENIVSSETNPVIPTEQLINVNLPGYYYFDGVVWQKFKDNSWKLDGNILKENLYVTENEEEIMTNSLGSNLVASTQFYASTKGNLKSGDFLGSINQQDLAFKTNNGYVGLINSYNISFGKGAFTKRINIDNDGVIKTTAFNNNIIAIGNWALTNNNGGNGNIAIGGETLISNTTGSNNIAIGHRSLQKNTNNSNTIAIGFGAMQNHEQSKNFVTNDNLNISNNTSVGVNSSRFSINLQSHSAFGMGAAQYLTKGNFNTAIGSSALEGKSNLINFGSNNTAVGYRALPNPFSETKGNNNTAIGTYSGVNTRGNNNIFIGYQASFATRNHSLATEENQYEDNFSNAMNIANILFGRDILDNENYTNSTARIGIGSYEPEARLHIKGIANTEILKLENITTGTGSLLVIDENGFVKKSTSSIGRSNNDSIYEEQNNKINQLTELIQILQEKIQILENKTRNLEE